ncbi:4'-phosphopantetheinyl transferase family protein [Alkalihalophilus marmarensis]|uniref:4'-phosphopantetheinyl transferase family protein n=1 Tax=Alkalihalophilus marmarensis TaxID=521377 RepID=UPI002DB6667A|nr:4'-phosphopantetheinyl transferase superfamily protein [Alkalihalophilus marmarensis]MEC2074259.1 4'-phosphopantetheinyl transferase superfamily protein [Alkalihalophilus marmarensis]
MKVFAVEIENGCPCEKEPEEKLRSLIGKLLILYILREYYRLPNNSINLNKNIHGKPFLQNNDLHFNITHSGFIVICAVNNDEVGVDVERVVPRKVNKLIPLFTKREQKYLKELSSKEQLIGFYKLWTRKESYIKALGLRLDKSLLKNIDVFIGVNSANKLKGYQIKTMDLNEKYIFSICSRKVDFNFEDIIYVKESLLYKKKAEEVIEN